jgi:SAM-dependent methyltransferase
MSAPAHERITELYEGTIGTPAEQRLLAARIHWMISQVDGTEVLDIGCGQGIAALLLAREGRRAVGIDRDFELIEWARERCGAEPEAVRRRLVYELAEATSLPFQDASFDAVLLGAVLEEQVDPGQVVREALRVLRPGGRLAITSLYAELRAPPFGEPLYLQGLIRLLTERIEVEDIALLDRYLAVAGIATPGGAAKPGVATWLGALGVAERNLARLLDEALVTRAELEQTQAELEQSRADAAQATERQRTLERTTEQQLSEARSEAQQRLDQLSSELMSARERLARTVAEVDPARRDAEETRQRLQLAERELSALRGAVGEASHDVAALQTERAALQAERAALVREATEAAGQAVRLQDALAAERAAASHARREATENKIEAEAAHHEIAEKDAVIDRLNERTSEHAQRVAALQDSLAAAEAERARLVQRSHEAPAPVTAAPAATVRRHLGGPPAPRVLHLLARSLPHAQCPIALDRHGLLLAQRRAGLDSSAMTDLDFPWDLGVLDPPSCEFIDGIAYYRLHNPDQLSTEDRLASATRIGEQLLDIVEPQILHAASLDVAPLAVALAEAHSLRCVVELANDFPAGEGLDADLLAAADQVVALSAQQRDRAVEAGVPEERMAVVPAFVDTARFAAVSRPRRNGTRAPLVGVVAYQPDSPAADALRDAIAAAAEPARGVVLRVAGADEPRAAEQPPPEHEHITETVVAAGEVPARLAQLDIVIAATPHEALDAMAAGRPVVGVGAARDVAPSIDELPELLGDRRLRSKRGAAARKSIEAHNTAAAVEGYARLYAVGGA